jgi:hypothetical protein
VTISYVLLAQAHSVIKSTLLVEFPRNCDDGTTIDSITKHHEYIRVAYGSTILPLPDDKVEVIVLLRAGIQALIGADGYSTLVDPLTEIKELAVQERARKLSRHANVLIRT